MSEPKNRLSPQALKVWRIHGILASGAIGLTLLVGGVFVYVEDGPHWMLAVFAAVALAVIYFSVFLLPTLRWRRWRYEVREQEVELQHGVWIIRKTLIPMVRVQHVDTEQGPILRKHKLAAIKISTAATVHEIPALDMEEAEEMRKTISLLARVADEDV